MRDPQATESKIGHLPGPTPTPSLTPALTVLHLAMCYDIPHPQENVGLHISGGKILDL